jgi:hypothetical protein
LVLVLEAKILSLGRARPWEESPSVMEEYKATGKPTMHRNTEKPAST